ncbi:MAG: sensor histidine kinase [Candidatus Dormiibacterota bacterium]
MALAAAVVVITPGHVLWDLVVASRVVPPGLRSQNVLAGSIAILAFAIVGALIVRAQPRNRIGWLMLITAVAATFEFELSFDYTGLGLYVAPGSVPAPEVTTWLAGVFSVVTFSLFLVVMPAIYPDGRLFRPWLRVIWVLLVVTTVAALPTLFDPTVSLTASGNATSLKPPFSLEAARGYNDALIPNILIQGALVAVVVLAWGSLVARYRKSTQDGRHQIKWLAAAVAFMFLVFIETGIYSAVSGGSKATPLLPIAAATLPIAIGVAVLRYRLYDIDVVISRTLVYGSLAAFITAVYVGIVVGVGTLVGSGGQPNLVLSIIATAIVAVAFQPVRERLNKIANRLVYGKRATPYEVLSQFSERVAETYAADEALPRMARVLAEGTAAEHAEVWLRAGSALRPAAAWPSPDGATPAEEPILVTGQLLPALPAETAVPVRHQGELLGALTVTKRAGESLTPIEHKLLDDLAHQAGLVLKNVGLTAELLARLDDLRASRQRLVAAQDEERRRLERNLHDGAQQNLVALKVKLGLAEMLAEKDPERAKTLLAELKGDTDETLDTLRDLARGIYPPLLADKGLAAAIEAQARKATLPVQVLADGIDRYPQEIEAAVYFCVLEGLQNVQKYAGATHAVVRLGHRDGQLEFEVEDDGKGFDVATAKKGSGQTNMSDRLDALGGTVEFTSAPGSTSVRGQLPDGSAATNAEAGARVGQEAAQ